MSISFFDLTADSEADVNNDDAESDTSSIIEIRQDEYPAYFLERDGRLFPSHGGPYPLPVDGHEQSRWNIKHDLLKELLHDNYVGPVRDVLSSNSSQTRIRALDLCTGTGQWVVDMAQEFPHVKFIGIDIVPLVPRSPPLNVRFEIDDVSTPFRYQTGYFDFVHARQLFGMTNYRYTLMLDQVSRVLRPGGLFLLCEWANNTFVQQTSSSRPAAQIPATTHYQAAVTECMRARGIPELAPDHIPVLLRRTNAFDAITIGQHVLPIGTWHPDPNLKRLGGLFRESLVTWMESMVPLLRDGGLSDRQISSLIHECIAELEGTEGMFAVYYTFWTRRL